MDFVENPLDERISELQDKEIEKSVSMINSSHKSVQLEGLAAMRFLISVHADPPIQKIIDSGIVPKFLEILASETETQFQIESSWCLLNICAREEEQYTKYIVELGGLDIIINLFDIQAEEVVRHAVWIMGNIAGAGSKYRDMCLQRDCIPKLLQILERFPTSQNIINQTLRGFVNLSQGKPSPQWDKVLPALPALHRHISEVTSQENLRFVLWALNCITSSQQNCQEVINQGFVSHLMVQFCTTGNQEILPLVLRIFGDLLAGDDEQMNAVLIFPEFLPKLFELTQNDQKSLRKEAFWMISNIAGGLPAQIDKIIENDDYMMRLKTAVSTEPPNIAQDVAYAIVNMFLRANPEQISCLVEKHGLLESLAHILRSFDDLKQKVLSAIFIVLKSEHKKSVKEAGLIEIVEDLGKAGGASSLKAKYLQQYLFFAEKGRDTEDLLKFYNMIFGIN